MEDSSHIIGQWMAEMVQARKLNMTIDSLYGANVGAFGSILMTAAPLHGFIWHSLARVPRDAFVDRAAELCRFGTDWQEDCLHGAGHGALLGVLFRSGEFSELARCYAACAPPRLFQGTPIRREHVLDALSLCVELDAAVNAIMGDCAGGVTHLAIYFMVPTDLASLAWLCELRPPSVRAAWPFLPPVDDCWEQLLENSYLYLPPPPAPPSSDGPPPSGEPPSSGEPASTTALELFYSEDCRTGILRPEGMRALGCISWLTVMQFLSFDFLALSFDEAERREAEPGPDLSNESAPKSKYLVADVAHSNGVGRLAINWHEFDDRGHVTSVSGCYGIPMSNQGQLRREMMTAWRGAIRGSNWTTTIEAWCRRLIDPAVEIGRWQRFQLLTCLYAAASTLDEDQLAFTSDAAAARFCAEDVPRFCETFGLPAAYCATVPICAPTEAAAELAMVALYMVLGHIKASDSVDDALTTFHRAMQIGFAVAGVWAMIEEYPVRFAIALLSLCALLASRCKQLRYRDLLRRSRRPNQPDGKQFHPLPPTTCGAAIDEGCGWIDHEDPRRAVPDDLE